MPVSPTYPGVYIEEIPSGVHTIVGVPTSITAFVGSTPSGPTGQATTIGGFAEYDRIFGGLALGSSMGFAVRDFFANGGSQAVIVRLYHAGSVPDNASTKLVIGSLTLVAADPGAWGKNLRAVVDRNVTDAAAQGLGLADASKIFNLTVREDVPNGLVERFANLSAENGPRRIDKVLKAQSNLVLWDGDYPNPAPAIPGSTPSQARDAIKTAQTNLAQAKADLKAVDPTASAAVKKAANDKVTTDEAALATSNAALTQTFGDPVSEAQKVVAGATDALNKAIATERAAKQGMLSDAQTRLAAAVGALVGSDSDPLTLADFTPDGGELAKAGLFALEDVDLFNLLCIPPYATVDGDPGADVDLGLIEQAAAYCQKRLAVLLIDPPSLWSDVAKAVAGMNAARFTPTSSAAIFFPRLKQPDPTDNGAVKPFAPCGAVAGVCARTDASRGVWKAPAGIDATLNGAPDLSLLLNDFDNGRLNPLGLNCLRSFPIIGRVVWGSRTGRGADVFADDYKYLPVRRTALFLEQSLYRGLQWAVFEPNDEPLWAQVRLNVGAFLQSLYRQHAFQGSSPKDAYFVKCDAQTTTQDDIDAGVLNVVVGFAPLKPAEFVVVQIQQLAGQIQT